MSLFRNFKGKDAIMEYTILIYKAQEGGFWAEVPASPGCYSQGETIEETIEDMKEEIESHLLALKEEKEVDREGEKLTENQTIILNLIKNDPYISIKEMSKH